MKKIIRFLVSLSLCFTIIPNLFINAEDDIETKYILQFTRDMEWGTPVVVKNVELYNIYNNKIGAAYKLDFGESIGYIIAVDYEETHIIVEASKECEFIYDNL